MTKTRATIAALIATAALTLTGCSETFTFEAVPVGIDDDDAEDGLTMSQFENIECFDIEADSSGGDDGDVQLGRFCRVDADGSAPTEDQDDE